MPEFTDIITIAGLGGLLITGSIYVTVTVTATISDCMRVWHARRYQGRKS